MTQGEVSEDLRAFVRLRAGGRCEYCLLPDTVAFYTFEIDHIVARKHGGETVEANLAYACWRCNSHKGSDLTSFDPNTGALARLYHPRSQSWKDHFALAGATLSGLTATGRTTLRLLQLESPPRIRERQRLLEVGHIFIIEPPPLHAIMLDNSDSQQPVDPLTMGELISLQEAAKYAGLSKNSLLVYIRNERLKAKKIGSQWVTTRAAIDEYLASRDLGSIPKKYRKPP